MHAMAIFCLFVLFKQLWFRIEYISFAGAHWIERLCSILCTRAPLNNSGENRSEYLRPTYDNTSYEYNNHMAAIMALYWNYTYDCLLASLMTHACLMSCASTRLWYEAMKINDSALKNKWSEHLALPFNLVHLWSSEIIENYRRIHHVKPNDLMTNWFFFFGSRFSVTDASFFSPIHLFRMHARISIHQSYANCRMIGAGPPAVLQSHYDMSFAWTINSGFDYMILLMANKSWLAWLEMWLQSGNTLLFHSVYSA